MPLRVVEWSTGTVGKHAVAGILARPQLELVGVWVSSEEKHGRDVGVRGERRDRCHERSRRGMRRRGRAASLLGLTTAPMMVEARTLISRRSRK